MKTRDKRLKLRLIKHEGDVRMAGAGHGELARSGVNDRSGDVCWSHDATGVPPAQFAHRFT